ncbi:hypothetical protein [Candidatus Nitrosotenuis cloacae]|uniref:hypothetical protein n=1 Tax=Candidatus Nitrosotenuis cloacae TaxID=1603555 RepID=UPI0022810559|nr:hypothetical protein [Candidatus Nitrosotenuis cloacae]
MANKHTLVVIASIAVIAGAIGYSSLGVLSLDDVQSRWFQQGNFDYSLLLFGGKVLVCNNSDFQSHIKSYSFKMDYDGGDLGTFVASGASIAPHTAATMNGKFVTGDKRVSESMLSFINTELNGRDVSRIDAGKMSVVVTKETAIMGFIPVSVSQEYSGEEFLNMMNQKTDCD